MYPVVFGPVCTGQGIRMQRLSVALLEGRYVLPGGRLMAMGCDSSRALPGAGIDLFFK